MKKLGITLLLCAITFGLKSESKTTINDESKTCLELNDLTKSGNFYYGSITLNGNNVKGEITSEDEAGESYTMTFTGTNSMGRLSVKVSYSNDAGGPYSEKWLLNKAGLVIEQPKVTILKIKCE